MEAISLVLYVAGNAIASLSQERHQFSTAIIMNRTGICCAKSAVVGKIEDVADPLIGKLQIVDRRRVRAPELLQGSAAGAYFPHFD